MKAKIVKLPLAADVYVVAAEEARKAGFTCVGTKIRHDIETYYRQIAASRATEEAAK
jgi:hypothetical protein